MYLDALSDLVGAYEDIHHPIEPSSDANMLRHLMEAKGMSQTDLHRETGLPKSTISQGQRALWVDTVVEVELRPSLKVRYPALEWESSSGRKRVLWRNRLRWDWMKLRDTLHSWKIPVPA